MVQLKSTPECTAIWQFRLCFSLHGFSSEWTLSGHCFSPHTLHSNSFCSSCCSCEWVVSSLHILNVCLHSMHFGFLFISLHIPIILTLNVPSDVKFNCIHKFEVAMYILCKEWLSKKTTFCSHYKC